MIADAWAIWFGSGGMHKCATFDRGRAPEIAANLHGTVHPMVYLENAMTLDSRSDRNLADVHPALVRVIREAHDEMQGRDDGLSFVVTEGLRTEARQLELFKAKATKTMNSRHLIQPDGTSHACDVAATINGRVHWDFPLYDQLADVIKAVAKRQGTQIVWGGDWPTFKDGPHYELDRNIYSA